MKLLQVSCGNCFMENDHYNEIVSPGARFNTIILEQFEKPCQLFNTQVVLSSQPTVDLVEVAEGKYSTLVPGMTVGPTDIIRTLTFETRHFKSRKNFYVTVIDEIMLNKIAIIGFKIDSNGYIEISGGEDECTVKMAMLPKKLDYAPDYKSVHGGILNPFIGQSFVSALEFLPEKKGIIVSYRKPSGRIYGNGKPVPDEVWQEKHEVVDGVLLHTDTRYGKHHPTTTIDEHTSWDSDWTKVTR